MKDMGVEKEMLKDDGVGGMHWQRKNTEKRARHIKSAAHRYYVLVYQPFVIPPQLDKKGI